MSDWRIRRKDAEGREPIDQYLYAPVRRLDD
jgi:hypothetical protein